jgi:exonuclease VII small subunit
MDFNNLNKGQLLDSLIAEVAKGLNEVRHAQDDLDKAESRMKFVLAVLHNLKARDLQE